MRDLNKFFKKYTSNLEILQRRKTRFLIFLNITMSAKSNKIELSEEFMAVGKEKQPPEVFCKKGVLRNFVKFTGKHVLESLC